MSFTINESPRLLGDPAHAQQTVTKTSDKNDRFSAPIMREKVKPALFESPFRDLNDDVMTLILSHAGQGVFPLGQTCKYFNLTLGDFLHGNLNGRKIKREKNEIEFHKLHGKPLLHQIRESHSDRSSVQTISLSDDDQTVDEHFENLKKSNQPAFLLPADNGRPITSRVVSALASRGSELTVIDIREFNDNELQSVAEAIKAIPPNGFVSLVISSAVLTSKSAAGLWDAISSHPIVAYIQCIGDDMPDTAGQVVEWVALLAKKEAMVSSFELVRCRLGALSDAALSTLLSVTTGIVELEISENEISEDQIRRLADAVAARNANVGPQLTVHFSANNLDDVINLRDQSQLAGQGLYFRQPDQIWAFQDQQFYEVTPSESPIHENSIHEDQENSIHEDSNHDDSSSVVGEPSSGDEAWGSGFESSADESDVVVASSSDDERSAENS